METFGCNPLLDGNYENSLSHMSEIEWAQGIIRDYLGRDPFQTFAFTIGHFDRNEHNLLNLAQLKLVNPEIQNLLFEELKKWERYPDIYELGNQLIDFLHARTTDTYGYFEYLISDNGQVEIINMPRKPTSKENQQIFEGARQLFSKRFRRLLKECSIL